MDYDPIRLEVFKNLLSGIAEEMGVTLRRTAYSPNIKERLDFSCALFDGDGRMISQAAHIPAHLGAMPASVSTILATFSQWDENDVVIVNDPFQGGNHLPDITMITPVFAGAGPPVFLCRQPRPSCRRGRHDAGLDAAVHRDFQEGIVSRRSSSIADGRAAPDSLD